jgi:hypothetical protein
MSARASRFVSWPRRFFAAAGVALLLLLTVSAASPALHHWFHGNHDDAASDNCAVVLFSSGLALAVTAIAIAAPRASWSPLAPAPLTELFLTAPRYLRQPERGPPAC